ncbi:hypothetical protein XELAEV_18016409mg [Xenopus laevis]|uniref:Uncharacterized protein n=1 Tax=Xenopus laevis TaxID=8355 RepID=A0A974DLU6_XENLA|nr:hypothetical protein XELAEV_18016409mg [Xenopus laevis]
MSSWRIPGLGFISCYETAASDQQSRGAPGWTLDLVLHDTGAAMLRRKLPRFSCCSITRPPGVAAELPENVVYYCRIRYRPLTPITLAPPPLSFARLRPPACPIPLPPVRLSSVSSSRCDRPYMEPPGVLRCP